MALKYNKKEEKKEREEERKEGRERKRTEGRKERREEGRKNVAVFTTVASGERTYVFHGTITYFFSFMCA
jgi:hypothetical protein